MEIHHAVEDIYRRNPGAFDDSAHLVAALSDYVDTDGAGAGEIRLVVDAVELGCFQRIRELVEVGAGPHAAIAETASSLSRNRATDEHRSAWACAVLAYATGLVNDADVRSYRSRWELATALPASQPAPSYPAPPAPPPVLTQSPPHTGYDPTAFATSAGQPPTQQSWPPSQPAYPAAPPPARSGPPRWLYGVLAAVVVLVLAGVAGVILLDPDPDPPDPPGPKPPVVGSCHALSTADISGNSDPKPPVPCDDDTATTITTDVVTVPDDVDRSSTEAVWEAVGPECARTTLSYLGGNAEAYARSAWTIAFFVPTAEEADAGADWARCDLTLSAGGETKPLPDSVEDSIDQLPLSDEVALCAEDQDSGGLFTTCDLPHAFRATETEYHAGPLPTVEELTAKDCPDTDPTQFAFATVPDQAFWDAGATYVVCFSFDS